MFGALDSSTSGLIAQRTRAQTTAANLANRFTLYDAQGNHAPFRRRIPMLAAGDPLNGSREGVHVQSIEFDAAPFRRVYEPGHPEADGEGYVEYPNIDPTIEHVNMLEASRAYEANITAIEATKAMIQASLRLIA